MTYPSYDTPRTAYYGLSYGMPRKVFTYTNLWQLYEFMCWRTTFGPDKRGPWFMPVNLISLHPPRRRKANIASVTALTLDLDQGEAWPYVRDRLVASGYSFIAYPSYNNMREKPSGSSVGAIRSRYRAIVFLDVPLTAKDYESVYAAAADQLVGAGNWDPAASDASRLWYLPRFHCQEAYSIDPHLSGSFLRSESLLELVPIQETVGPSRRSSGPRLSVRASSRQRPMARGSGVGVAMETFLELLLGDGFHSPISSVFNGIPQVLLTRPGKSGHEGPSITLNDGAAPWLFVFTSSVPWLEERRAYSYSDYLKARAGRSAEGYYER